MFLAVRLEIINICISFQNLWFCCLKSSHLNYPLKLILMGLRGTMLDNNYYGNNDGNNNTDDDDDDKIMHHGSSNHFLLCYWTLHLSTYTSLQFLWRRKWCYSKNEVIEVKKNKRHIIVLGSVNLYILKPIFKPSKSHFEHLGIDLCWQCPCIREL